MRQILTALAFGAGLVLVAWGLAAFWARTRPLLVRTVEEGPVASGLVPVVACGALAVLVLGGALLRLASG